MVTKDNNKGAMIFHCTGHISFDAHIIYTDVVLSWLNKYNITGNNHYMYSESSLERRIPQICEYLYIILKCKYLIFGKKMCWYLCRWINKLQHIQKCFHSNIRWWVCGVCCALPGCEETRELPVQPGLGQRAWSVSNPSFLHYLWLNKSHSYSNNVNPRRVCNI